MPNKIKVTIDARSMLCKSGIDKAIVRQIKKNIKLRRLVELLAEAESLEATLSPASLRMNYIASWVCSECNLLRPEMTGPLRVAGFVEARHIFAWLAKQHMPGLPLGQIGKFLNRGEPAVAYAIRSVESRMETEPAFRTKIMCMRSDSAPPDDITAV